MIRLTEYALAFAITIIAGATLAHMIDKCSAGFAALETREVVLR